MTYHLAQMNLATLAAPLESPQLATMIARLDEINHLAERSPGFVWRHQLESGHALDDRPFDDERIVVNMSVWESLETLWDYTYNTDHIEVLRQRRDWFLHMERPYQVLWYVPAGHAPTVAEGSDRLNILKANGPTPLAFDFKKQFTVEQMLAYTNP